MIDDHTFGTPDPSNGNRFLRWYQRFKPALTAALWFWVLFLLLDLIALFTGWASLIVTLSIQILLSFGAGWLAGRLYENAPISGSGAGRQGALTGLFLPLTTGLIIILVALWIGISSFGSLVPIMLPYFLSLPIQILLCVFLGLLGGKLAAFSSKVTKSNKR